MIHQMTFALGYFGKLVYDSDDEGSLNNSAWKQITKKCMDQPCDKIFRMDNKTDNIKLPTLFLFRNKMK